MRERKITKEGKSRERKERRERKKERQKEERERESNKQAYRPQLPTAGIRAATAFSSAKGEVVPRSWN